MHIEFETSDAPTIDAPDSFSGGGGSSAWPMLAVACVVGGMLAALLWVTSGSDSTATPDEQGVDQPVGEIQEDSSRQDADSNQEAVDRAVLKLEPQALTVAGSQDGASTSSLEDIVLFEGVLVGLLELPGVRNGTTPSLAFSRDGIGWGQFDVEAFNSDAPNELDLKWSDLRTVGNQLAVSAVDFDHSFDTYTSADTATWQTLPDVVRPDSGDRVFIPFTSTDETISGLYFDESATVMCADESEIEMGSHVRLVSIDRVSSEISPIAENLRLPLSDPTQMIPTVELADGHIGGLWRNDRPDEDANVCAGQPGWGGYDELFYMVDLDGGMSLFELPDSLANPDDLASSLAFLGAVEVGSNLVPLFSHEDGLWTVDLISGTFRELWTAESTDVAEPVSFVIAEANDRVYAVAVGELHVFDFITGPGGGGFLTVRESGVFASPLVASIDEFSSAELIFADDDRVYINASGGTWLIELPVELASCIRQYDLERNGFGVVDDYCVRQPVDFVAAADTALSQPLDLDLLDAQAFGGEILGLVGDLNTTNPPVYLREPPLYRSDDTTDWEPIETTVIWDEGPQSLWWIGIEQRGEELVAFAFAPGSGGNRVLALSSSDGREWTVTDDYGQGDSNLLLFSYTENSLLFIDSSSSVVSRGEGDGSPETLCRDALTAEGRNTRYTVAIRNDNGESVDPFGGAFSFGWSVPVVLGDGRVAVLDTGVTGDLAEACDGVLEAELFESSFLVGDIATGAIEAWTLPPEFEPTLIQTNFLGEAAVGGSPVFLFADLETLWILDPETAAWDSVPAPLLNTASEQAALSASGQRIYAIVDNAFVIGDLIRTDDGFALIETSEAFAMSDDLTESFGELSFVFASDERVVINTDTSGSWRVTPISRQDAVG